MSNKRLKNKVNVKARIDRHLRIAKDNISAKNTSGSEIVINNRSKGNNILSNIGIFFVLFFVTILIPAYPMLSSVVHGNNRIEFYRGNIDEGSIIEFYYGGEDTSEDELNAPILESADSFISVNTILNDERDLAGTNEIIDYKVSPGDSFSTIAYEFKVSTNSILWANDFTRSHVLRPGETIKIPPVSGLIHQVKKGENLSYIAKKYDIEESKIKEQNSISGLNLKTGEVLVIPGAIKKYKPKPKPTYRKPAKSTGYGFAKYASSQFTDNKGTYKLVRRKPYSGVAGNCTWYVASYKGVNWRGNANRWLANARAKGHKTGKVAKVGSIVQLTGRGYNPRYGHVAIVMEVKKDHIIVSDMNYRRLYEVTYRKIPINDRAIDGYIYVN